MAVTIYKLPFSSATTSGVLFEELPRKGARLSVDYYEVTSGHEVERKLELIFGGMEIYKCTYFSSCSVDQINSAYDKLISLEDSELLSTTTEKLRKKARDVSDIRHYAIFFDDGPYFEFVCRSYSILIDGHVQPS